FEVDASESVLKFLKAHGRPAHFLSAPFRTIEELTQLAATARQFGTMLTVRSHGVLPAEVLRQIGKVTAGRVNYKICSPGINETEISRMILFAADHLRS